MVPVGGIWPGISGSIGTVLKAYDAACQWLKFHGDEEVPDENG